MKILGRVVSTKPITLSRAAKLISRFAAVENGSSPAVSHYLQRAADAFNHLVQSHEKRSSLKNLHTETIPTSQINDGDAAAETPAIKKKKKGKSSEAILDSENIHSENLVRENENEITSDGDLPAKKKKKKRKRGGGDDASLDSREKVSEDLVRETVNEIVNDGDSTKKKKKKKKKRKTGDSGES